MRAGNSRASGDVYWRSSLHFGYESLLGKHILSTKIDSTVIGGSQAACYNPIASARN